MDDSDMDEFNDVARFGEGEPGMWDTLAGKLAFANHQLETSMRQLHVLEHCMVSNERNPRRLVIHVSGSEVETISLRGDSGRAALITETRGAVGIAIDEAKALAKLVAQIAAALEEINL